MEESDKDKHQDEQDKLNHQDPKINRMTNYSPLSTKWESLFRKRHN